MNIRLVASVQTSNSMFKVCPYWGEYHFVSFCAVFVFAAVCLAILFNLSFTENNRNFIDISKAFYRVLVKSLLFYYHIISYKQTRGHYCSRDKNIRNKRSFSLNLPNFQLVFIEIFCIALKNIIEDREEAFPEKYTTNWITVCLNSLVAPKSSS